ncbi:hypothetical protein D3C74_337640 [compost metagenome]
MIEHINACYRIIAFWIFRFFFNRHNTLPLKLGHSKTMWILNLLKKNLRACDLITEIVHKWCNVIFKYVISENDNHLIITYKLFSQIKRLCDPSSFVLNFISERYTHLTTAAKKVNNIPHVFLACDDKDILNVSLL